MWYDKILSQLNTDQSYSRGQLMELLAKERPDLSENSFKWIISEAVEREILYKKQRGLYSVQVAGVEGKQVYKPHCSKRLKDVQVLLEERFPLVDFVCVESVQLNEFLNHMIAQNTIFIMVERDAVDSVFRYLQSQQVNNLLLKPTQSEWDRYWKKDSVVLLNLVSEAPQNSDAKHSMSIEQLLVDMVADKCFKYVCSGSEIQRVYDKAYETYQVNEAKMLRYARRRSHEQKVESYLEVKGA